MWTHNPFLKLEAPSSTQAEDHDSLGCNMLTLKSPSAATDDEQRALLSCGRSDNEVRRNNGDMFDAEWPRTEGGAGGVQKQGSWCKRFTIREVVLVCILLAVVGLGGFFVSRALASRNGVSSSSPSPFLTPLPHPNGPTPEQGHPTSKEPASSSVPTTTNPGAPPNVPGPASSSSGPEVGEHRPPAVQPHTSSPSQTSKKMEDPPRLPSLEEIWSLGLVHPDSTNPWGSHLTLTKGQSSDEQQSSDSSLAKAKDVDHFLPRRQGTDFLRASWIETPFAKLHASEKVKANPTDHAIVLEAVSSDALALNEAAPALRKDKEIVLQALKTFNKDYFRRLPRSSSFELGLTSLEEASLTVWQEGVKLEFSLSDLRLSGGKDGFRFPIEECSAEWEAMLCKTFGFTKVTRQYQDKGATNEDLLM